MDPMVFYLIGVVVSMSIVVGTVLIAERLALRRAARSSGSAEPAEKPPGGAN